VNILVLNVQQIVEG